MHYTKENKLQLNLATLPKVGLDPQIHPYTTHASHQNGALATQEFQEAELYCILRVQFESFLQEIIFPQWAQQIQI